MVRAWKLALMAGLLSITAAFPLAAAGAQPEATTMHFLENYGSSPATGTLVLASGGIFGAGTSGTFVTPCRPFNGRVAVFHCVDTTTTPDGTFSFAINVHYRDISDTQSIGEGTWHIVDGTGAYAGAQGEGTFTDIITFPAVGDPTGESFWTGRTHFQ
jgi:hypothetical protein